MIERWHIVDVTAQNRVLQVCYTPRQARRAQAKWCKLWLWKNGPRTTVRRVAVSEEA